MSDKMKPPLRQSQESRAWVTFDNDNLDISGVVPLAETDGTLKVSVSPVGANSVGKSLGSSEPTPGTNTVVYTVPAATTAHVSMVSVCNKNKAVPAQIRFAISASGGSTPGDGEWVYYDLDRFIRSERIGVLIMPQSIVPNKVKIDSDRDDPVFVKQDELQEQVQAVHASLKRLEIQAGLVTGLGLEEGDE
jgi:hypothetical protein